ncbi:MAG: O-antigen ligase family protein [Alphaproteobacteria bacterium]
MAAGRLTRAVFAGLVATVALAPLPFASNRPWSWSLLAFVVGALLLLWATAAMRDDHAFAVSSPRIWRFVVMFAVVVAWIVVQASPLTPQAWHQPLWRQASAALETPLTGAISIDPQQTLTALMRLLAYAGVFWLALQLGRSPARARAIVWTVALAGLAYSVYGLVLEFAGVDRILWYRRWAYEGSLTSTFVNRNAFATYAGLALMATLGLLLDEIRRGAGAGLVSRAGLRWMLEGLAGKPGLLVVAALATGSALLLTDSRGGLVSAMVGLVVLAGAVGARPGGRPAAALVTVVGVVVFAAAILALSGDVALERLDRTFIAAEERPAVYRLVLGGILENPWLGAGYGTFESAFPLIRDSSIAGDLIYDKAHNTYLEFAFEAGVPAFALMMVILAGLTWMCVRGVRRRRRDRIYACVGLAATALVATHALVDFTLQIPAVAATYALLFGAACAQSWSDGDKTGPAAAPASPDAKA